MVDNQLTVFNANLDNPTVSARDLHRQLSVSERFSSWFERQLQYGFVDGEDYLGCKKVNTQAHQELQDYEISLDMAKQICMIQRTPEGKKVRQYLIDLEKAWNTPELVMARGLEASKKLLAQKEQEIKKLIADNEEMKPKAIFADAVSSSKTSILVGELAKLLKQNGVDIGQNRLFEYLRNNGYLIKSGASKNMPTQRSMDLGLFEIKENNIINPDGSVRITRTPKVTGKAQVYFINKFLEIAL